MSDGGRNVLHALDDAGRSTCEHDAIAFKHGFGAFRDRLLAVVEGALLEWPRGRRDLASTRAVPTWLELRASEGIFSSEDAVYLVGVDRRVRDRVEAALCRIPWEGSDAVLFDTKRTFCTVLGTMDQRRLVVHSHRTSGAEERSAELMVLDAETGTVVGPTLELDPTWLVLDAALGMDGQVVLVVQTEGFRLERSPASQLTWVDIRSS